jgi:hypothetical protein
MLCSGEIPADATDRDASGERPARGPYGLDQFTELIQHAVILNHEIPSGHVRLAADGFQRSLKYGREPLNDIIENIDRGLGDGARATRASRDLLQKLKSDDALAATFLDCVDLRRFIAPRPDRGARASRSARTTEVSA